MEQKETTTQQKKNHPIESETSTNGEEKNVTDRSPTTPTQSSWWGGLISQAKEKVSNLKTLPGSNSSKID